MGTKLSLVFAACLLATAPALGEDRPLAVDLVAAIVSGLADGKEAVAPMHGLAARTGAGVYSITSFRGPVIVTIKEDEPCVFSFTMAVPDMDAMVGHVDWNKISGVTVTKVGEREGLTQYDVVYAGQPGRFYVDLPSGRYESPDGKTQLGTALTLVEMEADIAAMREYCPGIAG